jgi:hypothetical protein
MRSLQEHSPTPKEYPSDAVMEMFIGTWSAIALVAEALAGSRDVELEAIAAILAEAEAYAHDKGNRHIAVRAVRTRIEALLGPGGGDPGDNKPVTTGEEEGADVEADASRPSPEERGKQRIARR